MFCFLDFCLTGVPWGDWLGDGALERFAGPVWVASWVAGDASLSDIDGGDFGGGFRSGFRDGGIPGVTVGNLFAAEA